MGDTGFLPERQCQIIGQIIRAQKTLPDDFWGVAAAIMYLFGPKIGAI